MTNQLFTARQHEKMRKTLQLLEERIGRKQLAEALGIATQTVSNLSQKQKFSRRIADAMAELTGLTLLQLLDGDAPRRCPTCGQDEKHPEGPMINIVKARDELGAKVAEETQLLTIAQVAQWLRDQAVRLEGEYGDHLTALPMSEPMKAKMMGATVWREAATMLEEAWSKSNKLLTRTSHDELAREAEEWSNGKRTPKGFRNAPEAVPTPDQIRKATRARASHKRHFGGG